ncbi:MAG: type II secretion system GspH family protein, partial [Actinobacteria bacterium]|nr:type II secretion system GspH family protein [Actinomycetota bacterium]
MARRKATRDQGFSLMELIVTMAMFSMLLAMVFTILITLTYQASDDLARSRSVEQVRLGISQIDRQVRSGNVILNPEFDDEAVSGVPPNYSLRIFTQEGGVGQEKCAQWRVYVPEGEEFGDLQYRTWKPLQPALTVSDWYIVAQNSVMLPEGTTIVEDNPETWPPFWQETDTEDRTLAQSVRITLRMLDP